MFPNTLRATYCTPGLGIRSEVITLLAPSLVHVAASPPHTVHKPKVSQASSARNHLETHVMHVKHRRAKYFSH